MHIDLTEGDIHDRAILEKKVVGLRDNSEKQSVKIHNISVEEQQRSLRLKNLWWKCRENVLT